MKNKLLGIINSVLENNDKNTMEKIDTNYELRNDLGFDSLELAELTVKIESEFGVDIFEDSIVETVGEIMQKLK